MKLNKKNIKQLDTVPFIDSRGVSEKEWTRISEIIAAHKAKKSDKSKVSKSKTVVRYDLVADDNRNLSMVSEPKVKYKKSKKKSSSKTARKSAKKSGKKN